MIKQISLVNRSGHTLRGILNFPEEKEIAPVLINLHGFGGTMGGYKGLHLPRTASPVSALICTEMAKATANFLT